MCLLHVEDVAGRDDVGNGGLRLAFLRDAMRAALPIFQIRERLAFPPRGQQFLAPRRDLAIRRGAARDEQFAVRLLILQRAQKEDLFGAIRGAGAMA